MKHECVNCGEQSLDKDTIGINKKLLGMNIQKFYCINCLAMYLDVSVEDLLDKIKDFKEQGCTLFI